MLCLPLTREVDFCEAKRRRERKRKTTPQSAAADSSPDKGSRQRLTTHLWVAGNRCVAGRPIKSALVRSQYRIGLCPKMKYPPLCGGLLLFYNGRFMNWSSDYAATPSTRALLGRTLNLNRPCDTAHCIFVGQGFTPAVSTPVSKKV